jgi:hypothetical protein
MDACAPRRFCPKQDVRRGVMATIIAGAFDLPPTSRNFFSDDQKSFEDAVNRVAAAGLMTGCGGTRFCPGKVTERGELAAILYRALNR